MLSCLCKVIHQLGTIDEDGNRSLHTAKMMTKMSTHFVICCYLFIGSQAPEVVVISNDTALRTGKTALLSCVGFGESEVEISWTFSGAPVVNTSLITIYEEDVVQGERIFKQSFLQICSLAEADAGGYTCIASDGFTTDNATTQLAVTS